VTKTYLSIIIPAHNEENRLPGTLEKVYSFLQDQSYSSEILVVENGSDDDTFQVAQSYQQKIPNLSVIKEDSSGKGLAVRKGMLAASGAYRFMCDADLSMPIDEVNRFIPPELENFDIAIASREAPGSIRYNEPGYRHWGGRGVNIMIRLFAVPGLHDTQCGFKMFRGDIAEDLFQNQTINNWSFDIELLFIARKRRYRITELPIPWYFNPDTKLNPFMDAFQMAVDIFNIHLNALRGVYDPKV
jgi:dolichyl-phosphate beta-glucosyltransferase